MILVQVPGLVIEDVQVRQVAGKEIHDVSLVALGDRFRVGIFSAALASRCIKGAEVIAVFQVVRGKYDKPELRIADVLPCK